MVGTSAFGFISYNSREFLINVLQDFINDGVFLRCACWYHESTGNDKNHFHCYVEPAKKIDTSCIVDKFIEFTEDGKQQSIAIRPKCKSKWVDAYLYGIHNSDYLTFKGKVREVVNIKTDMHIYLGDFSADIIEAEMFLNKYCLAPYARLKELVLQGKSLEEVYIILRIPFGQLRSVKDAYIFINGQIDRERMQANIEANAFDGFTRDEIKEIYESEEE